MASGAKMSASFSQSVSTCDGDEVATNFDVSVSSHDCNVQQS